MVVKYEKAGLSMTSTERDSVTTVSYTHLRAHETGT